MVGRARDRLRAVFGIVIEQVLCWHLVEQFAPVPHTGAAVNPSSKTFVSALALGVAEIASTAGRRCAGCRRHDAGTINAYLGDSLAIHGQPLPSLLVAGCRAGTGT
jgi:hypothetical protein